MINLIVTFLWSQCGIDLFMIVTNAMWTISLPSYKKCSLFVTNFFWKNLSFFFLFTRFLNGTTQKREINFDMKKVILQFDITSTGCLGLVSVRETSYDKSGFLLW